MECEHWEILDTINAQQVIAEIMKEQRKQNIIKCGSWIINTL